MDLILWRHAEAEERREGLEELRRALTPRGLQDADTMGAWLRRHLPASTRVLCSPALRCLQTARALGRDYAVLEPLAPDRCADELLAAAGWPDAAQPVLVVGHQPVLGQAIAQLLGIECGACAVRKAGVWWLRLREREAGPQTVVWTVQTPGML